MAGCFQFGSPGWLWLEEDIETKLILVNKRRKKKDICLFNYIYRGIHEKGSDDVVSAVCGSVYFIYLALCTQTAETTSSEPFS